HVSTPAPALSSKVGGLPAGLDAVFAQALSKNPEDRPPACRALADAVSAFLPTGVMPVVGSPAWGTPAGGMTAPTVRAERGGTPPPGVPRTTPWSPPSTPRPGRAATTSPPRPSTPPPVRVATPPPSLTSEATVLTSGRRKRRGLAWGIGIAAVVLVGLGIAGKMKREKTEGNLVKVNAPGGTLAAPTAVAPAAASTAGPGAAQPIPAETPQPRALAESSSSSSSSSSPSSSSRSVDQENAAKIRAAEEKRIAELEKRVKVAESAAQEARDAAGKAAAAPEVPAAPAAPPAEAAPEEGVRSALAAVRERLDLAAKPDRRLSGADFRFALETARSVTAEHPKNADARYLATYAEGGLAYVAGNDAVASALAVEAVLALRRAGRADHRALQQLLVREDGSVVAPHGWELAVAYGDARGEALPLLDAAVRENPRDLRARRARAVLRKMHGLEPEGPGARKRPG
ncbi:MAG TPA: hypothetical protein VMN04_11650, partial [Thermoanaerobaculia bacterium]|nr:hypothetical protein [Thermoanaerobaculia bacterium]